MDTVLPSGYNVKVAGYDYEPRFQLKISDFPNAKKICDQETEDLPAEGHFPAYRLLKQTAIYESPEFYRETPEGPMNIVQVFDGCIIGPYFYQLKAVRELVDCLLSL